MKKKILLSLLTLLCIFTLLLPQGNSQTVQEEDECDIEVFTGVRTYPPRSSDRFDWECQGEGLSCTEVYIICPRQL